MAIAAMAQRQLCALVALLEGLATTSMLCQGAHLNKELLGILRPYSKKHIRTKVVEPLTVQGPLGPGDQVLVSFQRHG